MKIFFALIVAMLSIFVSGMEISPSEPKDVQFPDEAHLMEDGIQPRLTCDFLSGIGYNHFFCASHCLLKGFKGGYCDSKGVCNCRN